jgi:SOS-response transcriptional repressor LexA
VPDVPLHAAAGAFLDPQHIEDEGWEWDAVDSKRRLHSGMFVAQVVGKSMEPVIPDGAYCLFAAPVTGTRQGKTVLVQMRDATDPETGQRYTVKRYESEKTKDADSWRHAKITLKPVNPDFQDIVLSGAEQGQLQVVAELIEVLSGKAYVLTEHARKVLVERQIAIDGWNALYTSRFCASPTRTMPRWNVVIGPSQNSMGECCGWWSTPRLNRWRG